MRTKIYTLFLIAGILSSVFYSCKKSIRAADEETTTSGTATLSSSVSSGGAISISVLSTTNKSGLKDSLYLIGCYTGTVKKDTVASANLLASITSYLVTNYSGYSFKKAFKITDSTSTLTGYVVIIKLNNELIGLKFDASGTFVKVLEQREGIDLTGKGWHEGGRFDHRDGKNRDSIAITALPGAVSSFFKTKYPTDTLLFAQLTRDTNYVLISKNNGLFATAITPNGTLVKRITIDNLKLTRAAILQTNLPANVTNYLTTTYPGYVFDKAYVVKKGTTIQSYVVFITSNSTKYAIKFDATGAFVAFVVIK